MDGMGRSISVRSGEIRLCWFFIIFDTDLPVCNSLYEQERMRTNCKDGVTRHGAMSSVYVLQLCFAIGFLCCFCGELTASRCAFRERVVRLVAGIALDWRRASLEIHEWRICKRVGLAFHRLSNHGITGSAGHAVRPYGSVSTFRRSRDVSARLQAAVGQRPQHRGTVGSCSGSVCPAQLTRYGYFRYFFQILELK